MAARIPAQGAVYSEDYDWETRDYFPEEISHVSAWHVPDQEAPLFQSPSSSFIATLEPSDVLRALTLKEPKVAKYRERANEVWLVINYDTGQLSTHFEDEEATFGATYVPELIRQGVLVPSLRRETPRTQPADSLSTSRDPC